MLFREDIDDGIKIDTIIGNITKLKELFASIHQIRLTELSSWSVSFITEMSELTLGGTAEEDMPVFDSKCLIFDKLFELAVNHTLEGMCIEEKNKIVYSMLTEVDPVNWYYMNNEELIRFHEKLNPTEEFYGQFMLKISEAEEAVYNSTLLGYTGIMKDYLGSKNAVLGDLQSRYDIAKERYEHLSDCYTMLTELK